MKKVKKLITVEEHYNSLKVHEEIKKLVQGNEKELNSLDQFIHNSLISHLDDQRISYMNKVGIDTQIIGYGGNSPMNIKGKEGVRLCKMANDELYEGCKKYPGRFYGLATVPLGIVDEAVKEIERCVKELGFVGIMIQGSFQGEFLDDKKYLPIFAKCEELDIPIYLHPGPVKNEVKKAYYEGNWNERVALLFSTYGIGWHYDTAIHLIRLIFAGILDKFPKLKIIIGHWGELLPFYLERLDMALPSDITGLKHTITYYFQNNIYTNPSGMYFKNDMDFCIKVMGIDHILWAQDFCYLNYTNKVDCVRTFLEEYDISDEDKEKIAHLNTERIFKLKG